MKKSISIVLSLLMVFSCFTCLLTSGVKAEAATNYVVNGDFEASELNSNNYKSATGLQGTTMNDSVCGQWYRAGSGHLDYPDYKKVENEDYYEVIEWQDTTTIPDVFAKSTRVVYDPLDSTKRNKVLRVGQTAHATLRQGTVLDEKTVQVNFRIMPVGQTQTRFYFGFVKSDKANATSGNSIIGGYDITVNNILSAQLNGANYTNYSIGDANNPGVIMKGLTEKEWNEVSFVIKLPQKVEVDTASGTVFTDYPTLSFHTFEQSLAAKNSNGEILYDGFAVAAYLDDVSLTESDLSLGDFTFEKYYNGYSLKVPEEAAKVGTLPGIGEWGWNNNTSYFGQILARETTLADGTTYIPTAAGSFTYRPAATMTVSNEKAHSGSNSLKVATDYGMVSVGLNVKKNTDYKLTYYCLVTKSDVTFKFHGIYSDLQNNMLGGGANATGNGSEYSQRVAEGAKNAIDVTNTTDWQEIEVGFNSGNLEKVYYAFSFNSAQTVYIDDLALKEVATPTSFGDLEDFAAGTSLKVKDITKFPENGEWGASKLAGYFGATYKGTNYDKYNNAHTVDATGTAGDNTAATFKIENSSDAEHGNVLHAAHTAWVASMGVAVEKNTNYILSYDIKYAASAKLNGGSFISTAVNTKALDEIAEDFKLAVYNLSNANSESWTSVSAAFNSGNLEKVYLVMNDRNGSKGEYYLDNITLTKVSDDSITTFGGASIRTTGNPALRFKSTIDVAAIEAATGATVSEFGFTAIRSDYLDAAALVKDGVYGSKKAVTGVAYQAGGEDNKILEQDGNKYTFRAALYNIGVNKDGSKFDYSILGKEFSVRTYVVLQHNGGTREVLYGETQSYSIFEVAKFLEENSTTYESDWNAVNSYLNAADQTADINNVANRAAAYEAWKENGSGYTGDIDK